MDSPAGASSASGVEAPGRVPDFFLVGHPKSGTSALCAMLRQQPRIFIPEVTEPGYFVPETIGRLKKNRPVKYREVYEDYLSLFAPARSDQLVGEGTTAYLWSQTAAERIAAVRPDARIIAILREPASFLRSLHMQFLRSHVETENDLGRALALDEARREGKHLPAHSTRPGALIYGEHVRYVEQLRRYHTAFSPEQVLVIIYDDYRADNEATVLRVLSFLGVEDPAAVRQIEKNHAKRIRSPRLYALVRAISMAERPSSRAVKSGIKAVSSQRMRHGALSVQQRMQRARPQAEDDVLMRDLRRRFKPEVAALSEFLGRDLVSQWGYDASD
jgi:hypothetical protein